jgi:glutaredoxin 2
MSLFSAVNRQGFPMNLYLYQHCPFCVRADMVANYKEVVHNKVYLANDDEETCFRLVNAKLVPILELDDGTAMPESMDIARKLDEVGNPSRIIRPGSDVAAITNMFSAERQAILCLQFPRNIQLGLPEFATASARDYFRNKKEAVLECTFEEAIAATAEHKAVVEAMLARILVLDNPARYDDQLSWDDVLIYPGLRNLTSVRGLQFPRHVLQYMQDVSRITATDLFFDRAI